MHLLISGEQTVNTLAAHFSASRSAISQHLRVLMDAGLVTARKDGRFRYYRLDPQGLAQLRTLFDSFWIDELDRLVADATEEAASKGDR